MIERKNRLLIGDGEHDNSESLQRGLDGETLFAINEANNGIKVLSRGFIPKGVFNFSKPLQMNGGWVTGMGKDKTW